MKNNLIRLHNYLKGLTPVKFIITVLIMKVLFNLLMAPIHALYTTNIDAVGGPIENSVPNLEMFIIAVIIAPIIESFIFQLGIIRILQDLLKVKNKKLLILISAIIFAAQHWYSPFYILLMIFPGIIYAYTFLIYDDKEYHPYLMIVVIHALNNLAAISLRLI